MEKSEWFGKCLDFFALLTTFALSVLLITNAIDYHFLSIGLPRMCGTPRLDAQLMITTYVPYLSVIPLGVMWGAHQQGQDIYISTRLFRIGIVIWIIAICSVN